MREYNYDPQYKYYISSSECFKSPVDENEYLVSSSATLIPPPQVQKNQIQIFDPINEIWNIVDDLRGTYYSIFTGNSAYNENPLEKPDYHTDVKPPLDFNQDNYKWNFEYKFWERLHPIYKVKESEIESISIEQKLNLLGISIEDLKKLLQSDNIDTKVYNQEKITLDDIDIDIDNLKNILEIKNVLKIEDFNCISLEEKLKVLNIDIEEIKQLFKLEVLNYSISNCLAELSLIQHQIQNFRTVINNSFLNIPIRYITPVNVSEISILRPTEIVSTSQKFENDNQILPSGFITISIDTGERKFGDGIRQWCDLPTVPLSQRYRFSRSLEMWESENPIPGEGIECYETDTGNLKIGNGFSTWDKLPYEAA